MKQFHLKDNLAIQLAELITQALLSEHNPCKTDGEETRVVIENPDGSIEPPAFIWYDATQNIIRIVRDED